MTNAHDLERLVTYFAEDLAGNLPDPAAWGIWLSYLLEELERQAAEAGWPPERYDQTLELLQRAASERLDRHR